MILFHAGMFGQLDSPNGPSLMAQGTEAPAG